MPPIPPLLRTTEDPGAARVLRLDAALALVALLLSLATAVVLMPEGRELDLAGLLLMVGMAVPLVRRRRWPLGVLVAHLGVAALYHALNYTHLASFPITALALFTVALAGPHLRTVLVSGAVLVLVLAVWVLSGNETGIETLRTSGWILAVLVLGEAFRLNREYVAAMRDRVERAERTREEEAARRVAEERLRIARDLHDLLAHSITLIGVRSSVAAHLIATDPGRLDRAALAGELDGISETCREARGELRATLQVLRGDDPESSGPPPGLNGLPDLAGAARAAGATVELTVDAGGGPVPPVVGAAAYRIVQEALTNAVRRAGPEVAVRVTVRREEGALRLDVADDGTVAPGGGEPGFGLTGMRERARSIGGTLVAAPRRDAPGFAVTAHLPLEETECRKSP
nr:histidine kinase [Streptomyces hainanensis]